MAKTGPFNEHLAEYEQWFIDHSYVFRSELEAIREVLPRHGNGVEIGIGSGLFAYELGIRDGVEPSGVMREKAWERGLHAVDGIAEKLPYHANTMDFALMVTTLCYVDDVIKAFKEVQSPKNGYGEGSFVVIEAVCS